MASGDSPENGVYDQLSTAISRMKRPLGELLATHDQFVFQNISIMNDIKSLKSVRRQTERAIENRVEKSAVSENV